MDIPVGALRNFSGAKSARIVYRNVITNALPLSIPSSRNPFR